MARKPNPRSVPLPKVGERIGDYVLEQLRGRGGMGAVYAARHVELGVRRAVKVERLRGKGARFLREAQSLARLTHPGVVQVHQYGTDPEREGLGFIVMDLVEGKDLRRELRQGPLPVERALDLAERLARTLAHLHAREVIHRDLKPANVLIRAEDGSPVLVDLGLSLHLEEDAERLTRTGQIVGTLAYMAPEQVRGEKDRVGPPADVFALGSLLYQMVVGQVPFLADHPALVAKAIQTQEVPPLSSTRRQLPRGLDALVQATLNKEPRDRPTAAQVADALAAIAAGDSLPERLSGRGDRRRLTRGLVAVLGLAVVLVTIAGTVIRGQARDDLVRLRAWETDVLDPVLLAAARDDPVPENAPESAELLAHLDGLARASRWLSAAERDQARMARVVAKAHLRLASLQTTSEVPIPDAVTGRSAADLTVDALALRAAGHLHEALARVEAAGPAFLPGRLLALRLLAETEPGNFLRRAEQLPAGPDRTLAKRLAPAASKRRTRDLLLRAPTPKGVGARTRLSEALRAARALGVDPASLGETKRAALDATAAAWETRMREGIDRDREQEVLTRLASLVGQAPRISVGPTLRGALTRSLNRLIARHERAVAERDVPAVSSLRKRVFRFEHRLFYEVDATPRETPPLRRLLNDASTLLLRDPYALLACMRYGDMRGLLRLERRLPPRALETLLREHPNSQVLAAHKLARRFTRLTRRPRPKEWEELMAQLSGLISPAAHTLEDLTARSRCALLGLLEKMLDDRQKYLTLEQQRSIGKRLLELGRRCRTSLWATFPFPGDGRGQSQTTVQCLEVRLLAANMLKRPGLRRRLYREEITALERRVAGIEAGSIPGTGEGERDALADILYKLARESAPSDVSIERARRSLALWKRCQHLLNPGERVNCHVLLSSHLRQLKRYDEAWNELQPHFHPWLALHSNMSKELVALAKATGQEARAAKLLRAVLGRTRHQRKRLQSLLDELKRSE